MDYLKFFETWHLSWTISFQNAFKFWVESDIYFFRYSILLIRSVKSKVAKNEEKKKHAHTKNTSIF